MTKQELAVYSTERRLIKKHFAGLQPRPIRIVRNTDFDGQAGEESLDLDARVLRRKGRNNLEHILIHELIHYQLRDSGKDYHGHGEAFLKRAAELGIVGDYELDRCFSSEEHDHTAGVRKCVEVPRERYREEIDQALARLTRVIRKLPVPQRTKAYREVNKLSVIWTVYAQAVKNGEETIWEEVLVKKPGRKGKSLEGLRSTYKDLQSEISKLEAAQGRSPRNAAARRKLIALRRQALQLWDRIQDDYGITL